MSLEWERAALVKSPFTETRPTPWPTRTLLTCTTNACSVGVRAESALPAGAVQSRSRAATKATLLVRVQLQRHLTAPPQTQSEGKQRKGQRCPEGKREAGERKH